VRRTPKVDNSQQGGSGVRRSVGSQKRVVRLDSMNLANKKVRLKKC